MGVEPAHAATFTVSSTGNGQDANTNDGICETATGNGVCTLRAAIEQANAPNSAGLDTIAFNIPASDPGYVASTGTFKIQPISPLPVIGDPVIIDGHTQPGFVDKPVIELSGLSAGALVDGLRITAGNSTVRGLAIYKFGSVSGSNGIELQSAGNNVIEGNFIGVDVTGTIEDPNGIPGNGDEYGNAGSGIFINGSSNNTIGGTAGATPGGPCTGACNIISGAGRGSLNDAHGVEIAGSGATGNVVEGNIIGLDIGGTLDFGNKGDGVHITGVGNNTIGGSTTGAGNTISGNGSDGVEITGGGATGNHLEGNYIGTESSGATATIKTRNGLYGVLVNGAPGNIIGGTAAGAGNVVSFNLIGIQVQSGAATGNLIQGNLVGTDVTGNLDLGNIAYGIMISAAPGNTIGGPASGARNVVSGNNNHGIEISGAASTGNLVQGNYIGTDITGNTELPNGLLISNTGNGIRINGAPSNTIGGTASGAGNVISGNVAYGIEIDAAGAAGTTIQGNHIGTNPTATSAVGNHKDGIYINGAPNTVIGGTNSGARNVISGNGALFVASGVTLTGSGASGTQVKGNFIGTDVSGMAALGNSGEGVLVVGAPGSIIGGNTAGARNVISGNGIHGVEIDAAGGTGNTVQGNYIGVSVSGNGAIANGGDGIYISDAPANTIGGGGTGFANVISGNGSMGVEILGVAASGNVVRGNYIGTNAAGSADLGNAQHGVFINGAPSNTIGGTSPAARNVISGNGTGVFIQNGGASGNTIQGNYIGTTAAGNAALGNTFDGVRIGGNASNNVVGGSAAGAGNTIAFNGANGVLVDSGTGNSMLSNSITLNTSLGIDLGFDGVTANDGGDGDSGANMLQNYPIVSSSNSTASGTTMTGTLNSLANTVFTIQLFSDPACDPSGFGEGRVFVGSVDITTDGGGNASYNHVFPTIVPNGMFVTATATDPSGNTSEFSACKQATGVPPPTLMQGDVDCSSAVNSVDALKTLRYTAGLPVVQAAACPQIGALLNQIFGDVDCNGQVNSVDALKILRFAAGLAYSQSPPCTAISAVLP
ncbi:MAG: hypothetical protein E6J42_04890 [Chloroflexi bacterium]|nr:MAG: hypothetical protein E6J42_04890 [Chloroflexota bacterium]